LNLELNRRGRLGKLQIPTSKIQRNSNIQPPISGDLTLNFEKLSRRTNEEEKSKIMLDKIMLAIGCTLHLARSFAVFTKIFSMLWKESGLAREDATKLEP